MPSPELSNNRRTKSKKASKNKGRLAVALLAVTSLVCVVAALAITIPLLITDVSPDPAYQPVEEEKSVPKETDKIFANIFINGIHVGDITKADALEKIKKDISSAKLDNTINLVHEDNAFKYKMSELGAQFDFEAVVNAAFLVGRGDDKSKSNAEIKRLETEKLDLEAALTYSKNELNTVLAEVAGKINKAPENATMERVEGQFVVTPEVNGIKVDSEALAEAVVKAIESSLSADITIPVAEVPAEVTSQTFAEATKPIGTFYTTVSGSEAGRNKNLDTASSKINDYVVYLDEIFSTNKAFGEMTTENGYRMAPVIVGGELTNGMGGGVCQVSSTLYMALLYAEIEIVERQNHSQKVGYADYGYDATLAGDYIDLKFRNNTGHPLTIESFIEGNKLYVNLYGYEVHEPGRRLEFYNVFTGSVEAPGDSIVEDPDLPLGERVVKTSARNGVNYDLYKIVFNGNTELSREHINTSKYRARAAVVHVGTGAGTTAEAPAGESAPPNVEVENNNPESPTTPVVPEGGDIIFPVETSPPDFLGGSPILPSEMPTPAPPKEVYVPGSTTQPTVPSEPPVVVPEPEVPSVEKPPVIG